MNYMKPYWENRQAACEIGIEIAQKNIGRIALIEMQQLTIPLEEYMPGVRRDYGEPAND